MSLFNIAEILTGLLINYPSAAYLIIFLVIFAETGVVFLPFLPGDSLLFILGALLSHKSFLHIFSLAIFLFLAAVLGDNLNYFVGKYFGSKILSKNLIKKDYIKKTEEYFKKYGNRTIFLSRFIPIIRTIAPFFAGIGKMPYGMFMKYNLLGGFIWIFLFLLTGYFFGSLEIVKKNLDWIVIGITLSSLIPLIKETISRKRNRA